MDVGQDMKNGWNLMLMGEKTHYSNSDKQEHWYDKDGNVIFKEKYNELYGKWEY